MKESSPTNLARGTGPLQRHVHGRHVRLGLFVALMLSVQVMIGTSSASAAPPKGPNWAKAWYSPVKYKACPSGKSVHIFIKPNYKGYKKGWWRSPGETHWGNSATGGYLGVARKYDTKRRTANWYIANVPDKNGDNGGNRLPSSAYYAFCE